MAAIDRGLSAIGLHSMEYHQSDPFLQRNAAAGIVETPFLGTPSCQVGQVGSIPAPSGINNNVSCFTAWSPLPTNPIAGAPNMPVFLGNVAAMPNVQRSHGLGTGFPDRVTRKHRHDTEDYVCPSKKRKLSSSPVFGECSAVPAYAGDAAQPCWNSSQSQLLPPPVIQPLDTQLSDMQPVPAEEMEEAPVESSSDAALRRIRETESRLIIEEEDDDDEEEEADHGQGESRLPTLVMSDVLAESLKHGFNESLTKKIVDSISRPSMELVLWKPQPEIIGKLKSVTSSCKEDSGASKSNQRTSSEMPFLQNVSLLGAGRPQAPVTIDSNIHPTWSKEEEEMEL